MFCESGSTTGRRRNCGLATESPKRRSGRTLTGLAGGGHLRGHAHALDALAIIGVQRGALGAVRGLPDARDELGLALDVLGVAGEVLGELALLAGDPPRDAHQRDQGSGDQAEDVARGQPDADHL